MSFLTLQRSITVDLWNEQRAASTPNPTTDQPDSSIGLVEGYRASKGGAFAISYGGLVKPSSDSDTGPLKMHLQHIMNALRPDDFMHMAVEVCSSSEFAVHYLCLVSSPHEEEAALIGCTFDPEFSVGLVLSVGMVTGLFLRGDGFFKISLSNGRDHVIKPVSLQTMWHAKQIILNFTGGRERKERKPPIRQDSPFLSFYQSAVSTSVKLSQDWYAMDDLESESIDIAESDPARLSVVKRIQEILRAVLCSVNIEEVTSKQIRQRLELEMNMNLKEYSKFIDQEVITVLGQMESPSQILDFLYLGSEWNASNFKELQKLNIGYILNVTREVANFFPDQFVYHNIRVYDKSDVELLRYWDSACRFIDEGKNSGKSVLVHCKMGISRSASTVMAYVMKAKNMTLSETMNHVLERRSIVSPNAGFQKQLVIYEGILNSSRHRYSKLFRRKSKSIDNMDVFEKRGIFRKCKQPALEDVGPLDKESATSNLDASAGASAAESSGTDSHRQEPLMEEGSRDSSSDGEPVRGLLSDESLSTITAPTALPDATEFSVDHRLDVEDLSRMLSTRNTVVSCIESLQRKKRSFLDRHCSVDSPTVLTATQVEVVQL